MNITLGLQKYIFRYYLCNGMKSTVSLRETDRQRQRQREGETKRGRQIHKEDLKDLDTVIFIFTQPLRSGRIWHKVNF